MDPCFLLFILYSRLMGCSNGYVLFMYVFWSLNANSIPVFVKNDSAANNRQLNYFIWVIPYEMYMGFQVRSSNRALGLHSCLYLWNVFSPKISGLSMLSGHGCEFLKFWPFLDRKMTNFRFIHKIDVKKF